MAYTESNTSISLRAGADLTEAQFRFVSLDADGRIVLTGAGETAVGVLQNDPDLDQAGEVSINGMVKVVSAGVITAGDPVAAAADGLLAVAGETDEVLGFARTDGVADQVVTILFQPR